MDVRGLVVLHLVLAVGLLERCSGRSPNGDHKKVHMTLSTQIAAEGDTVSAICDVEKTASPLVYWVRRVPRGNANNDVDISANKHVNSPFKETGRYHLSHQMPNDGNTIRFTLNITDVKVSDSGELICRLSANKHHYEDSSNLTVAVPVQKVSWLVHDPEPSTLTQVCHDCNHLSLREGQKRHFVCHVTGGYPKPEVKVYLGSDDLTSKFSHVAQLVLSNGPSGLQPLSYKVKVSHEMVIDYSFYNKSLTCVASLLRSEVPSSMNESLFHKSASLVNTLEYKPKFLCGHVIRVAVNKPNFAIHCHVRANPELQLPRVHFAEAREENETLGLPDYNATVVPVTDEESVYTLIITRVSQQHFRKYHFFAENRLGQTVHEISLESESSELRYRGAAVSVLGSMTIGSMTIVLAVAFSATVL